MSCYTSRLDLRSGMLAGATLSYPFVVFFGMRTVGPWPLVAALALFLVLRAITARSSNLPASLTLVLMAVAALELLVASWDAAFAARLYPVFMNAAMFATFAATLRSPPSMIERFARILEPDLSPKGVAYTRIVSWIWVVFFALNGTVALGTALFGSLLVWTVYNGFIAYALAGALFAGEFIVRRRVRMGERGA